MASWAQDFMAAFAAGLIGGISPGFRVAPPEAVDKAEETTEEDPTLASDGFQAIRTRLGWPESPYGLKRTLNRLLTERRPPR